METQRFLRLRELYDRAMQLPPDQRVAFADSATLGDAQLKNELMSLLDGAAAPAAAPAPAAPERIGPYRILSTLGQGGMGIVYLGLRDDGAFTKKVAVKLIRSSVDDSEIIARFRSERQVLASLEHPNIARILDGGDTQNGSPYYVMEYVEGEPLDEYCRSHKLDIPARVRLFQQLCSAVAYLHWKQILHRDLKPGNIYVTSEGAIKLLDFGIAKALANTAPQLTVGTAGPYTPLYASPEQLAGKTAGPQSDIYALGVILYQLLSGSLPDPVKIHPPSVLLVDDPEARNQLRGDLDAIVMKALQPDPARRYQTAPALAEDLERYLTNRPTQARDAGAPVKAAKFVARNRIVVVAALLIVMLAAAGGWFAWRAFNAGRAVDEKEAQVKRLLEELNRPAPVNVDPAAVDGILADVKRLRESLKGDWLQSADLPPRQQELRQAVIDKSARYLGSLRPVAEKSPAVAREVGYTYIALGDLQQGEKQPRLADRRSAVASFTAAAETLARAAGQEPGNVEVEARLADVERRLRALEAQLPREAEAILHPAPPAEPDSAPAPPVLTTAPATKPVGAATKPVTTAPAAEAAPVARPEIPPPAPAPSARERNDALDRLSSARVHAAASEQAFETMKKELAGRGLTARPQTVADVARMKALLEQAQADIARGEYSSAVESLGIVEALAARVGKEYGR